MKKTIAILLCIGALSVQAQKLTIMRIDLNDDKVVVFYAIDDSNPNNNYRVTLYSSKDNFAQPLTKVNGDVGEDVKPGESKKIEWNAKAELGDYEGEISLEVRAGVFIPFLRLHSFNENLKYKRGKTYPLLWTSGNMGGQIDIDLFEGQNRVESDRSIPNTGKYEFSIPGSVKPGKYTFRFTNVRNRDEFVISPVFTVSPRYSSGLKLGAVGVVGASVYFLVKFLTPEPPTTTGNPEIEIYPTLPKN